MRDSSFGLDRTLSPPSPPLPEPRLLTRG